MFRTVLALLAISTGSALAQTHAKTAPSLKCPSADDIDKLTSTDFSKGQFETTSEYAGRMLETATSKLGSKSFSCKLSFAKFSYDADKSEINLYAFDDITLKKENIGNGSYIASNAFGAKTPVIREIEKLWSIKLVGRPRVDNIKFKMTASLAKANIEKLQAVVSGEINAPWFDIQNSTSKPTFSIPLETEYTRKYIYLKANRLTIFNSESNVVFFDEPLRICKVYGMEEAIFGSCKNAR